MSLVWPSAFAFIYSVYFFFFFRMLMLFLLPGCCWSWWFCWWWWYGNSIVAIAVWACPCSFSNHNLYFVHTATQRHTTTIHAKAIHISLKPFASVHLRWNILCPFIFSLQHFVCWLKHSPFHNNNAFLVVVRICGGFERALNVHVCVCVYLCSRKWYSLAKGIKLQFLHKSDSRNLACSSSMSINVMC